MIITPDQIRAARALLRLDVAELARRAQLSVVTLRRLELADPQSPAMSDALAGVRTVLEQAGAEFIPDGVRKRRPPERVDADAKFQDLRATSIRSGLKLQGRTDLDVSTLYNEDGLPA